MVSLEEENFLRIVYLYYRVVTPSLKRFFDGKHSNLSADLSANKTKLLQLYNPPPGQTRVLYKQQIDTLYPPTGSPPVASADFDLTLMVCLLRHLPPVVAKPKTGFDKLPPKRDTTYGANIARIKYYKNYLVSHSTSGKIVVNVFNDIWTVLEMAIKGLGSAQDEADAKIAKTKILDSSMTTLLSTQHLLEIKIDKLEKRMEKEEITRTEITTRIKTFEEQTLTAEKSTKQLIKENKNKLSETLKEMQDKNHGECTRIDTNIKVIEKEIAELKKLHVGLSADDTKKQIESKCSEIQKQLSVHDERISALEEVKLQEDVKYSETKLDIEELRTEVAQIKTDRKSVPDWMIEILEKWKKEDEYFVNTRASEFIKDCLQKHVCVSVVGPSGVGKSFLVQHVALEMVKDGYTIMKVNSPEEIKENFMSNRPTLFVVDDLCGNFTANANRLDAWKRSSNDLTKILESNAVKLIVTCRLQVFQDEGFKHSDLKLFRTCICNLVEENIALTDLEKECMLSKYLGHADTNELKRLYQYDFFPLLCKLLHTKKDQSNFCIETFLEDPFSSFENEFNNLFIDCKESKYKIAALLLLVICNNHLDKTVSKGKEVEVKDIIEDILEQCCINECVRFKSLIKELDTLIGTFVSNEHGVYHTIHDKLFDFLAYYFGTKNEVTQTDFTELLIRRADEELIKERFVIKELGQSNYINNQKYVISIQDDNLQLYTERVFDDMTKANNGIVSVRSNRNRHNKTFQKTLSTIIIKLQNDKISNLIKTASSGFVCDMFLMDVNDIKINFPYGIILDHDHLQEFMKRIFDDMTISDHVLFYIRRCECCKNETFCTAFLKYMTNLSSTKMKELTKSCSTSFLQSMFVMEKEDIKLTSPILYERYGVVIPGDVVRSYIERVFGDITKSDDVYSYIKGNRNKKNTRFRTELLHLIERLDRSKIQHLIIHASQDFIDRLCVMTMEDTKVSLNWADEYCSVVVPADCIQLYMTRWFDGLASTKTCFIEDYFKKNRNRYTKIFQTSLLTFMAELQDDKIEKLIQTASNGFLRKLFVTTQKDIKHESTKEYEHYGIVLKDKYLALYTEKLMGSTEAYEDFINNMKDNRTIRQVLNYTRKLGISQITDLIQTASDNFFHKMIAVDTENELKVEDTYSDCQYLDYVVRDVLEMNDGFIKCPFSLIIAYMNRMVKDWGKGHIYVVIGNNNWKNPLFVKSFSDHLKKLEPSKLSDLVHIVDRENKATALSLGCSCGKLNFVELCLNIILHESTEQEQTKICALFLLVVFNNKLEEKSLIDNLTKVDTMISAFRNANNIREGISAMDVKRELNTSLNKTVVSSLKGVYSAIGIDVFDFLVFYFASIRHMSKLLVEYAAEKVLYQRFMLDKSFSDQYYFFVELPGEDLRTCIKKVFKLMTRSEKITRYTLDKANYINVKSVTVYAKTLTNVEIKTVIKDSCIDFINKMFVLAGKETKDHTDEYMVPYIVIPDDSINTYMKIMFWYIAKHDCVEGCLQDNRNKKTEMFRNKLKNYMSDINKKKVKLLIQNSSSDFINRMFLISKEDIKDTSSWEYEHYGIVVPDDLLQMYIERVFSDMKKSVYMPVNRNSENSTFQDTLYSYISSFSETKLIAFLETAGSKFIRRIFLSKEGDSVGINTQRYENYHICIPRNYYRHGSKYCYEHGKYIITIAEDDLRTFTITTYEDIYRKDALIIVKSKTSIDKLQQCLSQYIDPMFISKVMEISVRFSKLLVRKYTQRMVADWTKGNIHDVFGNVNFSTQSFRINFLTHLKNIEISTQAKLTEKTDIQTGDSALAVSCRTGIIELVEWCILNNANTNSCNKYNEHPLYIACNQNRPDIVNRLLHSKDKANANMLSGMFFILPLYEACKNGNVKIVSMLLIENIEVNMVSFETMFEETPLYVACKYGHIEIVSLLLDCKAHYTNINVGKIFMNKTPLYIACKRGHTHIVSRLLKHESDEEDFNQFTVKKTTPLYVACKGGYTDIVLLLLEHEIGVINFSRIDGASPLWIACQKGHVKVVYKLLDHECIEVDKCTLIGMSPLFIASFLGHSKIVETLLGKGADTNICVKKQKNIKKIFEKFEGIYIKPKTLDSNKYIKYIRQLVSENASENVKSYIKKRKEDWLFNSIFEASPLHMASLMGHTEIVNILIKGNSNINCLSENCSTPLFLACDIGHEDIVHLLLSNGADPTLDRKGLKSPLTIARDNGHTKIVEILKSQTVMLSNNCNR